MHPRLEKLSLALCLAFCLGLAPTAWSDKRIPQYLELTSTYADGPLYLHANIDNNHAEGVVYAKLNVRYKQLVSLLNSTQNWCEILILHINIKSCLNHANDNGVIEVFVGGKRYQPPEQAHRVAYRFSIQHLQEKYTQINLVAEEAPMGMDDGIFTVTLWQLEQHETLVKFSYSYNLNFISRLTLSAYLHTLGRNKIGFSTQPHQSNNQPVYVGGVQGLLERNIMRYFFALETYLSFPEDTANFNQRFKHWYARTMDYKDQLYDVEKAVYLSSKQQEWQNQTQRQAALDRNHLSQP